MDINSLLQYVTFYVFALLTILAAVMVIAAKNPVHAVLFLVGAFVCTASLWLLMEVEFLALVLIFVYVGAVMTLFLFVVMMLNIKQLPTREGFVRYLPFAIIVIAIMIITMFIIEPRYFGPTVNLLVPLKEAANYSNTKALGSVLYTQYVYGFELSAVLLLIAIISAISLTFRGRRKDYKGQNIDAQIAAKPKDRIRIVKMPSEKKSKPNKGGTS